MTNPPLNLSLAGPRIGPVGGYVPHYHITYTPGHAQIVAYFLLIFQASVDLAGKEC